MLVTGSFTSFTFFMSRLIRWILKGAGENRFDQVGKRIKKVLINVFGQKRLLNERVAGVMHFFIFWGFIFITVGTIEILANGIYPSFYLSDFLPSILYKSLKALEDVFSFIVACAIIFAIFRRLVLKPKRMADNPSNAKLDGLLILCLILGVVTTNLGFQTFKIASLASVNAYLDYWMPVSQWLAQHYLAGLTITSLETGKEVLWWSHVIIILSFLNYLPFSKHLHIMMALPNVFFNTLDSTGKIKKINLEQEGVETFGVGKVEEFSWKSLLDTYACTECGRCNVYCPTYNTGKDLKPKSLIADLRHHLYHEGPRLLKGEKEPSEDLITEAITKNAIWDCTTCGACQEACPVFIEHIPKIIDMRRNLVLMQGKMEEGMQQFFNNMENHSNPWGLAQEKRSAWTEGLKFKVPVFSELSPEERKNIEYLYFVGCSGSYDERNQKTTRALARLLNKGGVKFALLAKEEKCNGDSCRRLGNEYLAQTQIKELQGTFEKYNIKKILTQCPHCFNTFKNEYPEFGGNYEVVHHTQFLRKLLEEEKLKISGTINEKITYHDSCYLGRHNGEYESPREILKQIPGIILEEMPRNKEKGFCCGAGGGRMWVEEKRGNKRISVERLEEALTLNPNKVAAACPYCMTMLEDATKVKGVEKEVKLEDIAEILDSVVK